MHNTRCCQYPCSMSCLRLYMRIWVPHKKMTHSDQDLTHLMFSFSKSPFCGPKCQIIVTLFLAMLDNWFWCLTPGFWVLDIYMMLRSIWRSKTGWRGCRKPRTTSRSEVVTLVLSMLETWFWCQVPYSWSIGNHLGPFLWASAQSCRRPRTTSWSGDNYNEWKCNFGSESAGYLIFGSKPKFFLPWFGKIRKLGLSVDRCQTCSS